MITHAVPHLARSAVGAYDVNVHTSVLLICPVVNNDHIPIVIDDFIGVTAHWNPYGQVLVIVLAAATVMNICLGRGDSVLHKMSTANEDVHHDEGYIDYDQILLPETPLMLVTCFY